MQQPRLFERGVRADDPIEDEEQIRRRRIENFTRELLQLFARICVAGIAHRVVVLAGHMIHYAHRAKIPQIASMLEIFRAADRVPEAGGVHALPAVVGCRQKILRPEEFFRWIINQYGIVSDGAPVIVEIVWALAVGVVSPAVDRQITAVIDRDLVLIEMLVFGQVRPAIEFNPGRVRLPSVAHDQMSYAGKIVLPRQLILAGKRWIARRDFRVVPKELENRKGPLFWEEAALAKEPRAVGILKAIDGVPENGSVAQIQNWIFVITFARGCAVREQLVQVSVPNIAKQGVMVRGIYPSRRAL